jgi:signal transduction histidine kinase
MKKSLFFFGIVFFLFTHVSGQTPLPTVFEIKNDTAEWQQLSREYWQILEDKSGKLTIEQVSTLPIQNQFHDSASTIDATVNAYWLRYKIKNVMEGEANISINTYWEFIDTYIPQPSGKWKHFAAGFLQDWDKKGGLKRADMIPQTLQPGEEMTVYQRLYRKKPGLSPGFSVAIVSTDKFVKSYYTDYVDSRANYFGKMNLQEAFVLGLLLLAIFINLLFYGIVGEKVYLYFALFALLLGINRLFNISLQYFTWEHPLLVKYVKYLGYAWAFIPYFLIQFFRQFLKTKLAYPRWDKFLNILSILNIFIYLASFISREYFNKSIASVTKINPAHISFLLIPLCIVITLLFFIRKKDKSIRYLIIGSFPFLLLYAVHQVLVFFGLPLMKNFRLVEVACISWMVLSFTLILLMRFDLLRKENAQQALDNERLAREKEIERTELIEKQKDELEMQVAERTADLKQSIEELKSTQSQLIQSEKMASLGELTAGIAHEIQNPLNFVNNFSEVSKELLDEMREAIEKGDTDDAKEIMNDVIQNLEKINHHGKRADGIVKGMLQHSRIGNGKKEPTNINALADEYLRLAYHGLRAKDKSFNATMKTDFDETIGNINIIPQDIGRVILNLITNAFYVVNEKSKQGISGYEPTVSITTSSIQPPSGGRGVQIKVSDNGGGIPQKILDKIFQPFFTTKPTGQGTGLGLSLSYDIVKAHGGELKVETKENEGSTFNIQIPIS